MPTGSDAESYALAVVMQWRTFTNYSLSHFFFYPNDNNTTKGRCKLDCCTKYAKLTAGSMRVWSNSQAGVVAAMKMSLVAWLPLRGSGC